MHNLHAAALLESLSLFLCLLGLVDFWVKHSEVVAAQMVEHSGLFEVVNVGEDTLVSVCFNYFTDENGMVACREFVFKGAFEVRYAFSYRGGFHFFGGD